MHIPHSQLSSPSGRPPPHSTQPSSLPPTPTPTPAQLEPASSFPSSTYSINLSNPSHISPPRALAPGRASALPNRRYFKTKHPLSSGSTSTSKQVRICSCLGKAKLIFDCTISACSSVALALTMASFTSDVWRYPARTVFDCESLISTVSLSFSSVSNYRRVKSGTPTSGVTSDSDD